MVTDRDAIRTLARNIRRLMEDRRVPLTQQALAKAAGIQQSAVSRILNAHNDPSVCVVLRIADALGVPMDMLFREQSARILEKVY